MFWEEGRVRQIENELANLRGSVQRLSIDKQDKFEVAVKKDMQLAKDMYPLYGIRPEPSPLQRAMDAHLKAEIERQKAELKKIKVLKDQALRAEYV